MIRIANAQGFRGDSIDAPIQQKRRGPIDYLTLDYLAEVTMSISRKQRSRDPEAGCARDFVKMLGQVMPELVAKNIRVVANAGGLNPLSCRRAILALAEKLGLMGANACHGIVSAEPSAKLAADCAARAERASVGERTRARATQSGRDNSLLADPDSEERGNTGRDHMKRIPLIGLAHARSGDKGNNCNIGLIASKPEYYPLLAKYVTAARVRQHFEGICFGKVERFELPNLEALNFLLYGSLDGGGTVTLRSDPRGKTYSSALLRMEIEVDSE